MLRHRHGCDSLSALKKHVFEDKTVTLDHLLKALQNNFADEEALRLRLFNKTPFYGNDDDYADGIAEDVFNIYYDLLNGRPNTKGGKYRVNLLPTTVHIYFGSVVGALPNGRKAGETVSEGISPTQGADTKGPTAVVKSAARIDHARTGGTLLNMKFNPMVFQEKKGLNNFISLVRSYFYLGGWHMQFNVISGDTLREAQEHPDDYPTLMVRVAGYSAFFNDLCREIQDDIIERVEFKT